MEIFLAVLTAIIIVAILATILALAYPDVTSSIVTDIRQEVATGKSPVYVTFSKITGRISDGLNYRVKPYARKAMRWVDSIKLPTRARKKTVPNFKASDCQKCHDNLFTQRTWRHLYVDHQLHNARGIACNRCHKSTKHPKPKLVSQKTCVDCHRKRSASVACGTCHPPGSIMAKDVVSETATQEFLAGRSSATDTLMHNDFAEPDHDWLGSNTKGASADEVPCANCHQAPDFCNTCHMVFHDKVSNWRNVHGQKILRKEYVSPGCWVCHNPSWCSDTCHASKGLQRRRNFEAAPRIPLEDYL